MWAGGVGGKGALQAACQRHKHQRQITRTAAPTTHNRLVKRVPGDTGSPKKNCTPTQVQSLKRFHYMILALGLLRRYIDNVEYSSLKDSIPTQFGLCRGHYLYNHCP